MANSTVGYMYLYIYLYAAASSLTCTAQGQTPSGGFSAFPIFIVEPLHSWNEYKIKGSTEATAWQTTLLDMQHTH